MWASHKLYLSYTWVFNFVSLIPMLPKYSFIIRRLTRPIFKVIYNKTIVERMGFTAGSLCKEHEESSPWSCVGLYFDDSATLEPSTLLYPLLFISLDKGEVIYFGGCLHRYLLMSLWEIPFSTYVLCEDMVTSYSTMELTILRTQTILSIFTFHFKYLLLQLLMFGLQGYAHFSGANRSDVSFFFSPKEDTGESPNAL